MQVKDGYRLMLKWAFSFEHGGDRWILLATGPSLKELQVIAKGEREKQLWGNYSFGLKIIDIDGRIVNYWEI